MAGLLANDAVALGVGAFFGAMSRHQAGRLAAEWIATDPNRLGRYQGWHTAAINIGGSFVLGGVTATPLIVKSGPTIPSVQRHGLSPRAKLMLGVGFCGSFTTFSAYSVEVVNWIAAGNAPKALCYILINNVGGFAAAGLGMALIKKLFG
jgi:CrcB protein